MAISCALPFEHNGWLGVRDKGSLQNLKFLGMLVIRISVESLLLFDVLLTTYDIALLDPDFYSQIPWQYAVTAEAQILKNPNIVCCLLGKFIVL
ncbi:unnamed protein product [Eruca vesicaria subsp. sativa]|uniref:Uncharacterized protein n=1 Tax=Eruca vesicaria subsp. sativa TaxID=29727 RepID=A0ABC8LPG4_ERUVS|nr:unnamed protein product [Eruca vesicaria subsp. sativa]